VAAPLHLWRNGIGHPSGSRARLFLPVRPRVGADDPATGAHHARPERGHRHVIGPRVGAKDRPVSHTVWVNRAAFEAWTQSEAFRAAHHRAGDNKPLYLAHPQFEGFEVRQTVGIGKTQVNWAFGATGMVGGDGLHQSFGFKGFLESGAISR
jgi:heme-degrading monooxygenase HmoA